MQGVKSTQSAIPTAIVLLVLGLGAAAPAHAEYGAIARDESAAKSGWSWNQPTQKRADESALSECGTSKCKIIIRAGPATCAALASTADGKFIGAAARKDRADARLASLKDCEKGKAGECVVRFTDCNK
jgi:Domain of unknown function (DUF4189)